MRAFMCSNEPIRSVFVKNHRGIEQLAARQAHNLEVAGSSPAPATKRKHTDIGVFSFGCGF